MNEALIEQEIPTKQAPAVEKSVVLSDSAAASEAVSDEILQIAHGPRILGELRGPEDGPLLICVGSLHGNEPAGALALKRLFAELQGKDLGLCGSMIGLAGNQRALAASCRYLENDLNRYWNPERVKRLRQTDVPLENEDDELRDLDRILQGLLAEANGRPAFFLDLHTTSGHGAAFANLDDTLPNRAFALDFPVTLVVGIEEELAGTLASYLNDAGVVTVGFESGQHDEPKAVDRAIAAIWIALEAAGVIPPGSRPEVKAARQELKEHRGERPHVVEVLRRHAIAPGDHFKMEPGFYNFQPIEAGQILAHDEHGPVLAPISGLLLMPLYQRQGDDGFFLCRQIRPLWLKLSGFLRRRNLERYLHLMPGVKRNPELRESYIVDRRYARFFALEVFHLLGFRRHGEASRYLVMTRRAHDR